MGSAESTLRPGTPTIQELIEGLKLFVSSKTLSLTGNVQYDMGNRHNVQISLLETLDDLIVMVDFSNGVTGHPSPPERGAPPPGQEAARAFAQRTSSPTCGELADWEPALSMRAFMQGLCIPGRRPPQQGLRLALLIAQKACSPDSGRLASAEPVLCERGLCLPHSWPDGFQSHIGHQPSTTLLIFFASDHSSLPSSSFDMG